MVVDGFLRVFMGEFGEIVSTSFMKVDMLRFLVQVSWRWIWLDLFLGKLVLR